MAKNHKESSSDSAQSEDESSETKSTTIPVEERLEDDDQDTYAKLKASGDLEEFAKIQVVTGKISQEDLLELDSIGKARFADQCEAWIKAGRPRPQLPKSVDAEVEVIEKIYRVKRKGEQYLAYVKKGSGDMVGVSVTPIYGKIDGENGPEDDTSIRTGTKKEYTTPYKEAEARKLLEKAKRHNDNVQLYFIRDNIKILVHEETNFFADFESTMDRAVHKKERI